MLYHRYVDVRLKLQVKSVLNCFFFVPLSLANEQRLAEVQLPLSTHIVRHESLTIGCVLGAFLYIIGALVI